MSLECKDLIKIYPSPVEGLMFPALRGMDLSIDQGELISIIGPSGAGKTTLFRLISAFDMPSSGEIWFEGELVNKFSHSELLNYRQQIGVMYQSPSDNLIWELSVLDNVMLPMRYSRQFWGKQKERAKELLSNVGLAGKEKRKPSQLSGGEQQRVSIAIALANNPKMLLADEPTGELDSLTTSLIIDYFKELNQDTGVTICVATHDHRFSDMTDHTYRIEDGRLTTLQIPAKGAAKLDDREEVVIVDSQGNLRLPTEILTRHKGLSSVKVIDKGDKIELIPFKRKKS